MVSKTQRAFNLLARFGQKPMLALVRPQPLARSVFDLNARLFHKTPKGLRQRPDRLGGVACARVDLGGDTTRGTLLYLHGGAFVIGSLRGYRHLVAQLADAAGMAGLFVDYRLAPEHPFPAAPDDALAVYRALLDAGHDPARIAIAGDSAGGCLALSLLHRIGVEGLAMPGAVAVMSPIVDLTGASPSMTANAATELLIPLSWARRGLRDYLDGADPADPVASPINGQFRGAPPVMFQVCKGEILQDDSHRMAAVLRAQGVSVRLDEWQDVPHVWHLNAGRSPEADRGIADLAGFLRDTLDKTAACPQAQA
jgi:acetyl esterase/lipase